ncbi:hypothetical protein [Helicobacter sp. T3_23-1056]
MCKNRVFRYFVSIDCHDSTLRAESRNDDNATLNDKVEEFHNDKSTHPHPTGCEALAEAKTLSAREWVYFGLPRTTSCARNDGNAKFHNGNAKNLRYHCKISQ